MAWYSRARNLLQSKRVSRDINREMSFHLSERIDDLMSAGMSRVDAEREATRQFGHRSALHEKTRDADMLTWLESLGNDVKHATRVLRASPAFTFVAVLSLALGIGANTAIFSLINAVMLKSLPVREPEALVTITSKGFGSELSNPLWENFRDQQKVFANVAATYSGTFNLANGGEVRRVRGSTVSGDYFNTLGVVAAAGRLLTTADDVRGCAPTAVLSYGFWQSEFGGRQSAIGSTVSLDKLPYTIIGVTPQSFFGVEVGKAMQVYAPLCTDGDDRLDEKMGWFLYVIGRLKPEQTPARAQQELALLLRSVVNGALTPSANAQFEKDPDSYRFEVKAGVSALSAVRQKYSTALYALMAIVGVVLCIGCANVANLLLARSAARQREIAVRVALGAGRLRIVRQLLTETLLLAALGAATGLLFARWSTGLLIGLLGSGRNEVNLSVPIDARVLLFTIAVATLTALLFGLAPAWRSSRTNPQEAMRAYGRGIASGHSRFSAAKMLVIGQVALSLILVVGAGLLLGTFRTLSTLDLGFKSENVLLVQAGFESDAAASDGGQAVPLQLLERMRTIPGVTAASASSNTPVSGGGWSSGIAVEGFVPQKDGDALVFLTEVTDSYFATLQMPMLFGRTFDSRDRIGTPKVAVISQTLAKKFFRDANPVGKQFHLPTRKDEGPAYEVIGVVADSKYGSVKEDVRSLIFLPVGQSAEIGGWSYELRSTGNTRPLVAQVTALAKQMNPRITLEYRTLDDQVAASITRERLLATLSAFFGALALLLAMIGLYGTMSYSVQRRRNEIGVRLALGAARANVLRMVLGEVTTVLVIGLAIGTAAAMASSRFVASFLFGMTPNDPGTIVMSVVILATVALLAGAVPAWRASQLDPMLTLRED